MTDKITNCNTEFGTGCDVDPGGRPHACAYLGPHRVHECARCGAHAPNPRWVEPPDLAAEVAALRRQLDEARQDLAGAATLRSAFTELEFVVREEKARLRAAEADRDRLLVVYRAAEAWRESVAAVRVHNLGRNEQALAAAVDSYRSAAPAEPAPGDVGGVPVDTEETPA